MVIDYELYKTVQSDSLPVSITFEDIKKQTHSPSCNLMLTMDRAWEEMLCVLQEMEHSLNYIRCDIATIGNAIQKCEPSLEAKRAYLAGHKFRCLKHLEYQQSLLQPVLARHSTFLPNNITNAIPLATEENAAIVEDVYDDYVNYLSDDGNDAL